jgi:hypothetical protein
VLTYWKMAPVYCQVVLAHDQRITLDGALAETVDAQRIWRPSSWRNWRHGNAAKETAAPQAKSKPLTANSTQLRDRVRAGLLRRK